MSDENQATGQPNTSLDEVLGRPLGGFSPSSPNYRPLLPADMQGPTVPSRTISLPNNPPNKPPAAPSASDYPTLPDGVPTPGRVPAYPWPPAPVPLPVPIPPQAPRSAPLVPRQQQPIAPRRQPLPVPLTPARPPMAQPMPQPPLMPQTSLQYYSTPPTRSRGLPVLIEALAALFGIFGLGWLFAGRNATGILLLAGGLLWDLIGVALFSTGIGAVCFLPFHVLFVTLSAVLLSGSIRRSGYA